MADPVDYSINAHSIFVDTELSYNTKQTNGSCNSDVCSEESAVVKVAILDLKQPHFAVPLLLRLLHGKCQYS